MKRSTDHVSLVEALSQEVLEITECVDDLDNNIEVFINNLTIEVEDKIKELAEREFCSECGARFKPVVNDTDGTNLEDSTECSNSDCSSH